jgi:predicted small metal-binding protein
VHSEESNNSNLEDRMKELRCKNLKKGCGFVARGRTIKSVMTKVAKHARAKHKIEKISAAMAKKVRAAIHTV